MVSSNGYRTGSSPLPGLFFGSCFSGFRGPASRAFRASSTLNLHCGDSWYAWVKLWSVSPRASWFRQSNRYSQVENPVS